MYKYKCVEVPQLITIGKKDSHSAALQAYEALINEQASDGWEYVGVDAIESFFQTGCFTRVMGSIPLIGGLFRPDELLRLKMIIFKKQA